MGVRTVYLLGEGGGGGGVPLLGGWSFFDGLCGEKIMEYKKNFVL